MDIRVVGEFFKMVFKRLHKFFIFYFLRTLGASTFLFFSFSVYSTPYQLISNESALVIQHLNFEVKEDAIYSKSYIQDWGLRTQFRVGFFNWMELSFATSFNFFPDITGTQDLLMEHYRLHGYDTENLDLDNPRISYIEPKIKFKLFKITKEMDLVGYLKYKYFTGIPIIIPYPEEGDDPDAIGMVAANATEGHDFIAGLIAKIVLAKNPNVMPVFMIGAEGLYFLNKNWQENWRQGQFMVAATLSPEVIFNKTWMIQIENRFEYWFERGWRYEVMPGIRYEIKPKTIVELGVGLPILGVDMYRIILGFTYEFGKSFSM
jgi:hypothetical protein